ncbi:MAG: hypothetical protein E7439_03450 [Ruminococcaceae bacterium]|nr:hypothetical protein [Oscillospiraceae bacterium]
MKKLLAILFALVMVVTMFAGCTAADNINHNLSQAADNFEVVRRITVYNARTDLIVMEMEGYMSISNNGASELVVTCKTGANEYKKNYVYLNEYVIYVVEDITGTVTDPYHYKVHFYGAWPDVDINH